MVQGSIRRGRVAPAGFPTGALARSGLGDLHHPALPVRTARGGRRHPQKFRRHPLPSRSPEHGALPRFVRTTGRLRSTGSTGLPCSPASPLLCSPPTPLRRRPRLWFPSPLAYPEANACSEPAARAFANARRVGGLGFGSSAAPNWLVDRQGPPRLRGRPLTPRRGRPPRRVRRPLRPILVTTTAAFRDGKPLGTRDHKVYGAAYPTAQMLACLPGQRHFSHWVKFGRRKSLIFVQPSCPN